MRDAVHLHSINAIVFVIRCCSGDVAVAVAVAVAAAVVAAVAFTDLGRYLATDISSPKHQILQQQQQQ